MNNLPYQPVFWGDIYAEMIGFSLEEQAAYVRLRSYHWMHGPLTNDWDELRQIVGATKKQWSAIYSKVMRQFVLGDDNRLHHEKVEAELVAATVKRTRAQNGGFARAESIRNKDLAPARPAHARPARASISKSKSKENTTCSIPPEGFEEFWAAYGRRGTKPKAMVAYDAALKRTGVTPSVLLAAARSYRAVYEKSREFNFQKYAEGWLDGDMWEGQKIVPEKPADTRYNPVPHIPLPTVQW